MQNIMVYVTDKTSSTWDEKRTSKQLKRCRERSSLTSPGKIRFFRQVQTWIEYDRLCSLVPGKKCNNQSHLRVVSNVLC